MKKMGRAKGLKIEGGLRTRGEFHKSSEPGKPLISIITVVLNCEKHLKQTIQSVINQTYDNIEYIIVDGDSTDGTLDIVRKYDNQIAYWICERDSGIYDAMNKGIASSNGVIIGVLNAGDYYFDENVLESIAANCTKDAVLYGKTLVEDTALSIKYPFSISPNLLRGMTIAHSSLFVPRIIYEEIGFYSIKYRLAADYDMLLRIIMKGYELRFIDMLPVCLTGRHSLLESKNLMCYI